MIITESELNRIIETKIREAIQKLMPLNKMAMPRKEYMSKFEALFPQLLENLVLIIYAKNVGGRYDRYVPHWSIELKTHMNTLSRYSLKKNNNYETKSKAIYSIIDSNDWLTERAVLSTVYTKLTVEGINQDKENVTIAIRETIELIQPTIETILNGDPESINNFVDELIVV